MEDENELNTKRIVEVAAGVTIGVLAAKLIVQIIKAISA